VTSARLAGSFALTGTVTVANGVSGEHVGQRVKRKWSFIPACPKGPCSKVGLKRERAGGATDVLILRRTAPGYYTGESRFYAPLRCAGQTLSKGELVPFTITVRVTGASMVNGVYLATAIRSDYVNRERMNMTRCVMVDAHDAATYRGTLIPPSTGGVAP
jgi:hypothetical protein